MISFIMQLQMAIMISFIMQLQMAKNRYSTYHHWSRIHSQPNPSVVLLLVIVATYAASIGLASGRSAVARPRPASVRTSVDQTKSGGRIVSSVEQPPPSSTHSTLARLSPSNIVEQPLSARSTLPSRSSQSSNLVEQVQPPSARHSSVGRSSPYYSTEQVEPSSARPASALRSSQSTASVVFRNHRPTSFLIPPPCTASPSSPFSLRRSFAAIIISLRSANKQSKARDMPSPKPFATAAGMLRSRLSPSIRTRSGGGDGPSRWASPGHQERPNGYLFNRTPPPPGQSRKWEDWELPCYITSFLTIVILGVGLNAKPDLTIETWAHQKALERLEAQQLALSPSSDDSD